MKLTFLGTGTSTGVPSIGCDCETCLSGDPRDKRLRVSILIEHRDKKILVDTSIDFRQQALRARISHLDAVLITHCHVDHVFGLDDIRPLNFRYGAMGVYANEVAWTDTKYPVGTIIIKTPERALYFVEGNGMATRYAVGVGREGFQWGGVSTIVAKAEWPGWTPPKEMIVREAAKGHFIPAHMDGGPGNPLGARAMYLGGTVYRIHGTNNPSTIGGHVSSGCIRMTNEDVADLYSRVNIGTKVIVKPMDRRAEGFSPRG